MQSNPIDLASSTDAAKVRFAGEASVKSVVDFRHTKKGKRRTTRTSQIGLRTTPDKHEQFQRIATRTDLSLAEVFEMGLDALERELDKGGH